MEVTLFGEIDFWDLAALFTDEKNSSNFTYQNAKFSSLASPDEYKHRIGTEELKKDLVEGSDAVMICVSSDNLKVVDYTLKQSLPLIKKIPVFVIVFGKENLPKDVVDMIRQNYQVDDVLWCDLANKKTVESVLDRVIR